MACQTHSACQREFRMNRQQRTEALDRAFHLDRYWPDAPIPGRFPYRWEVRKMNLIICHWSSVEQFWYVMDEDTTGEVPGICVHIVVMLVQAGRLIPSIDIRKHLQAQDVFTGELLKLTALQFTVPMDDLEQDRILMKQMMDEEELPVSWKPKSPPPSTPSGYR